MDEAVTGFEDLFFDISAKRDAISDHLGRSSENW